ncbi:hypothetical protein, partial [Burkholderia cepacia]|uniref:hypothetical protein n=1 Tax=Burkholderia cepacia TaxID=292 RepID=UPI001CF2E8C8
TCSPDCPRIVPTTSRRCFRIAGRSPRLDQRYLTSLGAFTGGLLRIDERADASNAFFGEASRCIPAHRRAHKFRPRSKSR